MQPATYDLIKHSETEDMRIYQGDTYDAIAVITLPDLSGRGRPSTLTGATVAAQIRDAQGTLLESFAIQIVDATNRQIKPTLSAQKTSNLPVTSAAVKAYWDLQVEWGGFTDTMLRGKVSVNRQETQ